MMLSSKDHKFKLKMFMCFVSLGGQFHHVRMKLERLSGFILYLKPYRQIKTWIYKKILE